MNVVYDISALGRRYREPEWTGGLCRTIERVAMGLKASGECNLRFSAAEFYDLLVHSEDYLKTVPAFEGCVLSRPFGARLRRPVYSRLRKLDGPGLPFVEKVKRKVLYHLDKAASLMVRNLIDGKTLAEAQIFHSPLFPFPAQTKSFPKLKRFLTIYDMIPILLPEVSLEGTDEWLKGLIASLRPDDSVLCISHSTKADLLNYRPDLDSNRVFVTHLGADAAFHPGSTPEQQRGVRERYGIPGPYLLSVATVLPHKNVEHLVRCFVRMCEQEKIDDLTLVLAGHKAFWAKQTALAEGDLLGKWNGRIVVTGYVPDEDLAPLYGGALGLVFPSIHEGFGLPPLEAMQCGTPVITSNTSSLPEVAGDAAILVSPTDADALCAAMLSLYRSPELRAGMRVKSLAQAKKFSWEKCARDTLAAYRAALSLN
jgi:glycosyltransferase involved in cell wall biosynthesis